MGGTSEVRWTCLAVILLLAGTTIAQSTSLVHGEVQAEELSISGTTKTQAKEGVVHVRADLSDVALGVRAEEIDVNYGYHEVIRPNQTNVWEHQTGRNQNTFTVQDTELHVSSFYHGATPEVVAVLDSGTLSSVSRETTSVIQTRDQWITQIGESPNKTYAIPQEPQGFWYQVKEPWTAVLDQDRAEVTGDFTLVVHNATFSIGHTDGEWTNWTGNRERPGPAPGTQERETRIAVLTVINGSFWLSAPGHVETYAPQATMDVEGMVEASRASGSLIAESARYRYQDSPLTIEGKGILDPRPAEDAAGLLTTAIDGSFAVEDTPGLTVETTGQDGPEAALPDLPLPPTALSIWWAIVGLASIAVVGVASQRDVLRRRWEQRQTEKQEQQVFDWIRAGDRQFQAREFEKALYWFEKIKETYPSEVEGFSSAAPVLEELGRYAEAADDYETAAQKLKMDTTYLAQAAKCAWLAGQEDRAVQLAVDAVKRDPDKVWHHWSEPEVEGLREHPDVRRASGEPKDEAQGEGHGPGPSYV